MGGKGEMGDRRLRIGAEDGWDKTVTFRNLLHLQDSLSPSFRLGCRGFWDPKTDNFANETFANESLFCVAAAFGVYLY